MPDDLDDLLRRAMKSLDDQVPSEYFEALPEKALARLEASMQSGPASFDREQASVSNAVPPKVRDEDSGLHDIRNLAQSTKQRLSKRMGSSGPAEEDVLAQTSAGWKAVALPEPAKMVSLPSLDELPSKAEVLAKERAPAPAAAANAPATAAASEVRAPFSRPAKKSGGRTIAVIGLGLAAAAGVTLYFVMGQKDAATKEAPAQVAMGGDTMAKNAAATPAAAPAPAPEPPKPEPAMAESAGSGSAAAGEPDAVGGVGAVTSETESKPEKTASLHRGVATKKLAKKDKDKEKADTEVVKATPPPPDTKNTKGNKTNPDENEPSFDALLKQAGVDETKKPVKPKLDKKELTGDDFKTGMAAISSKAQGCYKGTQGNAKITVMVAPSGKVSSVSVSGQFAGKPEADCVTSAVKAASFPPWDGAPQRFTYVFLLSE